MFPLGHQGGGIWVFPLGHQGGRIWVFPLVGIEGEVLASPGPSEGGGIRV